MRSHIIHLVFVVCSTTLFFQSTLLNSLSCDTASECASQNLTITDRILDCNGYSSCAKSPRIELIGSLTTSAGAQDINCDGSESCTESSVIILDETTDLDCNGYKSCTFTSIISKYYLTDTIIGSNLLLRCNGALSCANSVIIASKVDIECNGDYACLNTTIYDPNSIEVNGQAGLLNAVIYTPYISDDNIITLITLNSYQINDLANLTTYTLNKFDLTDYELSLSEIIQDLSSVINSDQSTTIDSMYDISSDLDNCDNSESSSDYTACDDIYDCSDSIYSSPEILCCRGTLSCNNTYVNIIENVFCDGLNSCAFGFLWVSDNLICSGTESCINTKNFYLYNFFRRVDVYCTGYHSCARPFTGTDVDECVNDDDLCKDSFGRHNITALSNNYATYLYCNGSHSCENSQINSVSNIYAFGANSLNNTIIVTNNQTQLVNVYFFTETAVTTKVECYENDYCFVHCKHDNSCDNLIMEAVVSTSNDTDTNDDNNMYVICDPTDIATSFSLGVDSECMTSGCIFCEGNCHEGVIYDYSSVVNDNGIGITCPNYQPSPSPTRPPTDKDDTDDENSNGNSNSLSQGAIDAIIISVVVLASCIICVCYESYKCNKDIEEKEKEKAAAAAPDRRSKHHKNKHKHKHKHKHNSHDIAPAAEMTATGHRQREGRKDKRSKHHSRGRKHGHGSKDGHHRKKHSKQKSKGLGDDYNDKEEPLNEGEGAPGAAVQIVDSVPGTPHAAERVNSISSQAYSTIGGVNVLEMQQVGRFDDAGDNNKNAKNGGQNENVQLVSVPDDDQALSENET